MNFNIPDVGFQFTLSEDWTFSLVNEYRNSSLWDLLVKPEVTQALEEKLAKEQETYNNAITTYSKQLNQEHQQYVKDNPKLSWIQHSDFYWKRAKELTGLDHPIGLLENMVTLPKGTILKVDRIYIRKGAADYSSITYNVKSIPNMKTKKVRFFASLDESNKLSYV